VAFTLEDAIILATEAHKGQIDKAGEPYILHPLRVMFSFAPYEREERMVAVLHDVIEDTDLTAESLFNAGVPAEVVGAVVAMTFTALDKSAGMTYWEFIKDRVCKHPLARRVKRHDIADNMSMERLLRLPSEKQDKMRAKYIPALELLERA